MNELKAEPLTTSQLDRWLSGKIPRRILVAPFGGPLDAKAKGRDLDREYFDDEPCGAPGCNGTDFYGPYPALKASRDRLVDFHHATFLNRPQSPAELALRGAIMGRVELDEEYSSEDVEGKSFAGLWGNFWANAGEKRRQLIGWLEQQGHPLYGSTVPLAAGVRRGKAGHLCQWPITSHTISTAPQNAYAIVPPLKAVLDAPGEVSVAALRAFAADLDDLGVSPSPSAMGDDGAKAGRVFGRRNEGDISAELTELEAAIERLQALIQSRQTQPREVAETT